MKAISEGNGSFRRFAAASACALVGAGLLLLSLGRAQAQLDPSGGPTNIVLQSWSFYDTTNWYDDGGYLPISFTNLTYSQLGDDSGAHSLVVDTNVPAWLRYNIVENDGTTNLTLDNGTVTFWFAPGSWSSTNAGGTGPGDYGRLLEVGSYTPDSSYGLWSIYVDPAGANLYFSAQTNDLSSNLTTYVTYPISWATNVFHFVALTYSATNTTLYLDGIYATNGPGVTVYPGLEALTNGFGLGSDSSGIYQAFGLFDWVATYSYPMNSNDVWLNYQNQMSYFVINPYNVTMVGYLASAFSTPTYTPTFDVITGQGGLQLVGPASTCSYGTNAYNVWITNVVATASGTGSNHMSLTFTIEGGADGASYDVFANSLLSFGINSTNVWAWMGQGYHCNTYTLTNLPVGTCFLILGTPQDTSGLGLTDAYEWLVAKVNPGGTQTDANGVPYAWYAENDLTPITAGMGLQDPDLDGLPNYQEYLYGTRPSVSEGFSIWMVNGTAVIP